MNRWPDRWAILAGRRTRFNSGSSEGGLRISAVKSLIYSRGPAAVGIEIVVADVNSILLFARAGGEGGGGDVGLIDSLPPPVKEYLHHLSALKIFGAQNVQARELAGERESNNPGVKKIARSAKGHGDVSGDRAVGDRARHDRVERPGVAAVGRNINRGARAFRRIRCKRRGGDVQGISRIDGDRRLAVLMILTAERFGNHVDNQNLRGRGLSFLSLGARSTGLP